MNNILNYFENNNILYFFDLKQKNKYIEGIEENSITNYVLFNIGSDVYTELSEEDSSIIKLLVNLEKETKTLRFINELIDFIKDNGLLCYKHSKFNNILEIIINMENVIECSEFITYISNL